MDEFETEDGINAILTAFKGVADLEGQEKEDDLLEQFSSIAKNFLWRLLSNKMIKGVFIWRILSSIIMKNKIMD